ncbi:MAG TPA: hypothetical protein VFX54_10415 [Candidatus Binatia bacterium]|jgi:hypothetical protein|nr:hypothetical protein [Candidatus Binatia bacterium]
MVRYFAVLVLVLSAGIPAFDVWNLLSLSVNTTRLNAAQQNDSERLKELGRIIEQEIGTPAANEPSQCKLIAFGSKPCGGPARYLVYSTAKTNETRLKQLVDEFNQLAKKINEERKILSDCMFVSEPKVELVDGVCRIL